MNWFDTAAHAAEAGPAGPGSMDLILLIGFVAIFYFLLWRPQSKRRKEHQSLMSSLDRGDEVVTAGGIVGEITKTCDRFINNLLSVHPDGAFPQIVVWIKHP